MAVIVQALLLAYKNKKKEKKEERGTLALFCFSKEFLKIHYLKIHLI